MCVCVFVESERRERMAEAHHPQVTEIKVRIDCNGCVQKIRKAFQGIDGIEDVQVDFVQHKIIVTGPADPGKLLRAIRKTRKSAVLWVNQQNSDHVPPPEGGGEGTPSPAAQQPEIQPPEPNQGGAPSQPPIYARIDSGSSQPQVYDAQVNVFRPPPTVGRCAQPVNSGASLPQPVNTETDNLRPPAAVTRYAVNPVCSAQPIFYHVDMAAPADSGQSQQPAVYASHSNIFRPPEPITRYANPVSAQPIIPDTDMASPVAENSIFRPPATPYLQSPAIYIESEEDDDYMYSSSNNIASVFSEDNPNSCNIA